MPTYTADALAKSPTLHEGHCCNLKLETSDMRVWLCRVERGVTIERLVGGRWKVTDGSCTSYEASDPPAPDVTQEDLRCDARLRRRGF